MASLASAKAEAEEGAAGLPVHLWWQQNKYGPSEIHQRDPRDKRRHVCSAAPLGSHSLLEAPLLRCSRAVWSSLFAQLHGE
eukprot:COSAG04_NODE_24885_length_315_cov_0.972222_1_plen_80_part_10